MKRFASVLVVGLGVVGFAHTGAALTTASFGDSGYYWGHQQGWAAAQKWNTDVAMGGWDGNRRDDVIGSPDIKGGTVTFGDSGSLMSVVFDYVSPERDWRMLAPGNLFINVVNGDDDTRWDYVVTTMGDAKLNRSQPGGGISTLPAGGYSVYDIRSKAVDARRGVNDSAYVLTGPDNAGYWAGYILRNGHPIGIAESVLSGLSPLGSAWYSGFPGATGWVGASTYDFSGLGGLDLQGKDVILAWQMTCANDVVYERVANPVPEPASMILLGTGFFGLAGFLRRKARRT